MDVDIVILA